MTISSQVPRPAKIMGNDGSVDGDIENLLTGKKLLKSKTPIWLSLKCEI